MDPVIDNEWLGYKNDPVDETNTSGNIARSWQCREQGINPLHSPSNKTVFENIAEDILVKKQLKMRCCDLPGYPRSTFLMVFSPDGTKVASTHGNHNVYVSELASGKHVRILKGHPRTPWCIAFHPSHPQLISSGCLGGQVRVWDISSGGSEVWNVRNETVIASIAFHPREQLLVIATYNELYFWDWSQPAPFTKVSTNNINEKVRYVAFDALGYKLITGISIWSSASCGPPTVLQQTWGPPMNTNNNRRDDSDDNPSGSTSQENSGTAQDMIVNSYQNLVQRYDNLVRNYQRLFMVRHRLISNPPPPNMIDRGTDPMEIDVAPSTSGWTRSARPSATTEVENANPSMGTSRRQDISDNGDGESSSSRLLNLDVLSFDNNTRTEEPNPQERCIFGLGPSAFQPLNESSRSFRTVDQSERTTRLLPNPFSSSSSTVQSNRNTFSENSQTNSNNSTNTSRTSIFTSSRPEPLVREFLRRRRNSSPSSRNTYYDSRNNSSTNVNETGGTSTARPLTILSSSILENLPSTSRATTQRPIMTNSSTQMSPVPAPVDQTINESLNLIRDILRDSGTRLLNLITNMSLSTLESVERNSSRRGAGSRAHSDDTDVNNRPMAGIHRDLFLSSSDSDSDQSLEVNIFRTRNTTFRETENREAETTNEGAAQPTDRLFFEINNLSRHDETSQESNGFNVSMSNSRFRVRTQNNSHDDPQPSTSSYSMSRESGQQPSTSASARERESLRQTTNTTPREREISGNRSQSSSDFNPDRPSTSRDNFTDFNPDRPSTSRDNFWSRGSVVPPEEAYRKVKYGLTALQKHTVILTNMWLRGNHVTMRILRVMWENLRRRILMLHRETGRQDLPNYYTRSLLERCMMLTEMSDNVSRSNRSRGSQRNDNNDTREDDNRNSDNGGNSNATNSNVNNSTDGVSDTRSMQRGRSPLTRPAGLRSSPSIRRRFQSSYRLRLEEELRRRSRNLTSNRWAPRYSNRSRRDFARAVEISATRHEIRMRAMQVLSAMFNMMMMCLEERGLSQLIINMLRTLKKALALTCLMLMTNRNNTRSNNNSAPSTPRVGSLDVVRIENVEHPGPVNVDGPDDHSLSSPSPQIANVQPNVLLPKQQNNQRQPDNKSIETASTSISHDIRNEPESSTSNEITDRQRWSDRLAVQIAAANRNNSITARNRRESYLESRRQKALHRTNPAAHPLNKRRMLPPASTYKIPVLRSWNSKIKITKNSPTNTEIPPRIETNNSSNEPVAGPSSAFPPAPNNSNQESPRSEVMNEFEHRVNLIRIAHMQAIRLRNAARNRFRRLQTIRLYTPSAVREMFNLPNAADDNQTENGSPPQDESDSPSRRPHILSPRNESTNRSDDTGHFRSIINNVLNMPIMQINDHPVNSESQDNQHRESEDQGNQHRESGSQGYQQRESGNLGNPQSELGNHNRDLGNQGNQQRESGNQGNYQQQRFPRIHEFIQPIILAQGSQHGQPRIREFLQPIILAQNAMLVDDNAGGGEGGGGGGGGGGDGGGGGGPNIPWGPRRMTAMASLLDAGIISEALPSPSHRVQAWDFTTGNTPDISDSTKNVVVQKCRIHNDASIDISKDGRLLVALLPVPRLRNTNHWLGVYSLEWSRLGQCLHTAVLEQSAEPGDGVYSLEWSRLGQCLHTAVLEQSAEPGDGVYSLEWSRLGQCLHTAVLEQSAVSVALSPTARHLAVGLGSRRFTATPNARNNVFAFLYRLDPLESSSRTGLSPIRELEQTWEHRFTSLNCLRWAPQPGQGLVYANNTGQLIIMS